MVQQAQPCPVCGKQLGYIAGLRGFGFRDRRHAARCLARAGAAMACVAMEDPTTKVAEVENTQVPCTVTEPAEECVKPFPSKTPRATEECVKVSPSPVSRRIAVMSPKVVHRSVSGSAEVPCPPLLSSAPYYSAEFVILALCRPVNSAAVWDELATEVPQASEPVAPQLTTDAEERRCQPEENTHEVSEQGSTDSNLPSILATMLDTALVSGDLGRAVDQVIAERNVLAFHYTWLQHKQTPLPQHLENERKRLGVNENDWQTHLSITEKDGFYLDVSDPLREEQFPAGVEFDARRS